MKTAIAFVSLLALAACATAPTGPEIAVEPSTRFDSTMAEFAQDDAAAAPPTCAIVFTGSSSIRRWNTLTQDFPHRKVLNRGFGGSTIAEVDWYFDKVVTPYKPAGIVFYAGENDINAGKTPDQAYADFETFMALKSKKLGKTPVWFISSKPSKLRLAQIPAQAQLNAKVKKLADKRDDLAYIDIVPVMLKPDGSPKDIFVEDNLHMTPEGYKLWTPVVEAALAAGQKAKAPGC